MSHSKALEDPRNSSLEVPYTFPNTWFKESADGLATSGMMLSGLIMVTRNRFLAWPTVIFGINGLVNSHPMRTKEGGANGWMNIGLALSALIASYIPVLTISPLAPKA